MKKPTDKQEAADLHLIKYEFESKVPPHIYL